MIVRIMNDEELVVTAILDHPSRSPFPLLGSSARLAFLAFAPSLFRRLVPAAELEALSELSSYARCYTLPRRLGARSFTHRSAPLNGRLLVPDSSTSPDQTTALVAVLDHALIPGKPCIRPRFKRPLQQFEQRLQRTRSS